MDVEYINVGEYEEIPVSDILKALYFAGLAESINDPSNISLTMEAVPTQALAGQPVLCGGQGNPGRDAITLFFRNNIIHQLDQLPTDLGNTVVDIGKFWVYPVPDTTTGDAIATIIYVWTGIKGTRLPDGTIGQGYVEINVGTSGPPGPYPVATNTLNPVTEQDSTVGIDTTTHGTPNNPAVTWNLDVPQGIRGPSCPLGGMIDVDLQTNPPLPTQQLVVSDRVTPATPTGLTATGQTGGGTLPAGTYYYGVAAVVPNGETTVSTPVECVLSATGSVSLQWAIPTGNGATGFHLYRGTSPSALNQLVGVIISGTQNTFTDTGALTAPATPSLTGIPAGLKIWVPGTLVPTCPTFYTAPQIAFSAATGVAFGGSTEQVLEFAIPPQPWPWIPIVLAEVAVEGANLSLNPLYAAATVNLSSATGQQVAAGNGNTLGAITLQADFGSLAVSPESPGAALVPANHTGDEGTLCLSLDNQGLIDFLSFDPTKNAAYLGCLCFPVISGEGA